MANPHAATESPAEDVAHMVTMTDDGGGTFISDEFSTSAPSIVRSPKRPPRAGNGRIRPKSRGASRNQATARSRAAITGPHRAVVDALEPGTCIEHFELIRELGHGGMGTVFLARDTQLGRLVALKILTELRGSRARRFLAEARATARVKHENIVSIYQVGEYEGHPYMVLEYIEGRTLRDWLIERAYMNNISPLSSPTSSCQALSVDVAVELMIPVVRALIGAHRMRIVHRDLKPENILIDDPSGSIKVVDFGIAKVLEDDEDVDSNTETLEQVIPIDQRGFKTRDGAVVGTMPYMSPEQWGADTVDHRSDLWSVGVILYELVCGAHPLAPLSRQRLMEVASLEVPMPSAAETQPDLGPLGSIIDACLQKRKGDRIDSAAALLTRLESLSPLASTGHSLASDQCPYMGLTAFQEQDAPRFFGRDRDVAAAISRLQGRSLLALAGPSGAGKSSLVRAGLIPGLKRSGASWDAVILRPSRHPMSALVDLVLCTEESSSTSADEQAALIDTLREQPGHLGVLLRARARERGRRVLVFVDQFEELYTLGASSDERTAFIRCIEAMADDPSSPIRVILAVRSDFLDRMVDDERSSTRRFVNLVTLGLLFLRPVTRAGLRHALTQPLRIAGYEFEDQDMVEDMLDALQETRSPLPLLQFTAAQLWDERDQARGVLTRACYRELGGMAGALARHADTILAGLSSAERERARNVFLRLVTPERTRAVVSMDEMRSLGDDGDAIEAVVQLLADARLLTIETSAEQDGSQVELVHESLIERWPRFSQWLSDNERDALFIERVRLAAKRWHEEGRSEEFLWRGRNALEARAFYLRHQEQRESGAQNSLGTREEDFLVAVIDLADRSRRRRRQLYLAGFALLGLVALVVSYLAVTAKEQARRADVQAMEARVASVEAASDARRARNATRMALARELQSDPTTVLALVRELEPPELSPRWTELARWALHAGVAERVLNIESEVRGAAFSPDGSRLVTASNDGVLRIWDMNTDDPPRELIGHDGRALDAVFSPDGTRVASSSADGTVRIWRLDGSDPGVIVLRGHEARVLNVAFSRDGLRVVSASWDKTARVWNLAGQPATSRGGATESTPPSIEASVVLAGHEGNVYSAMFSPDGTRVVTASWDRTARIWNADGSGEPMILGSHPTRVYSAAFSPDGTRVVTAAEDKLVRVWQLDDALTDPTAEPLVLEGHVDRVYNAVFSPDGTRIASASWDRDVWLWSADGVGEPTVLRGHNAPLNKVRFSADGTRLVSTSDDSSARIWRVTDTGRAVVLPGHRAWVETVSFSPDGTYIATTSGDRTVRVRRVDGTGEVVILEGHGDRISSVTFSSDGTRILSSSADRTARVWNADGSGQPVILSGHTGWVTWAAFSPDGTRVATASFDGTARVWNADGSGQPVILSGHEAELHHIAFSPDGQRVATSSFDGTARVWQADGHGQPTIFDEHQGHVYAAAFSPDGTRVITASADQTARVWRVDGTGQTVVLSGHEGSVDIRGDRAFTPDGERAITHSGGAVWIWNTDGTGEPVVLLGADATINGATISPDGQRVAAAYDDGSVWIWSRLDRFSGHDDARLWRASRYCMPVALRMKLSSASRERAESERAACIDRVAAARSRE